MKGLRLMMTKSRSMRIIYVLWLLMLNLWCNLKQAKTKLIVFTLIVEIFLLYVPTQNKFRRIQFRINDASVQHLFHILLLLLL